MSKIGNQPINIPEAVEVTVSENQISAKGPKGQLNLDIPRGISLTRTDGVLRVSRSSSEPRSRAVHGLTRALIANTIEGVNKGFNKTLELKGIGYKAEIKENKLVLNVGFSHQVLIDLPEGITAACEKNQVTISGIDKQTVGEFAAYVRSIRPPEPYKGKGIRYVGEVIKLKPGKQAARAAA